MSKGLLKSLVLRALIFGAIIIVASAAFFYFADKINKINADIDGQRQKLVNFNETSSALLRLEKDIKDAQAAKKVLDKALPTRDALLARQPQFDSQARQYGLLQSVSFSSETKASETSLGNIAVQFQVIGPISSFLKYLKIFGKEILISISDFDFSSADSLESSDARINFKGVIPVK